VEIARILEQNLLQREKNNGMEMALKKAAERKKEKTD
jgi:hypothetical protein